MRVTRERRGHDGTLTAIGTKTCDLIAAAFGSLGEPWQHRAVARDLVRQVIVLNDHLAPHIGGDDRALAENLLYRRGWALWCLNELADSAAQAVDLGQPLVADLVRVLGESHRETLTSRNNLAAANMAAGRPEDAVALHERTLADRVRVLGESHPATLTSRNNLALAYEAAGRAGEAIPLYEASLAGLERVLGTEHPNTVTVRGNLAQARREAEGQGSGPVALRSGSASDEATRGRECELDDSAVVSQ
jgi:tetratricopeptide (TPR) repeat protein